MDFQYKLYTIADLRDWLLHSQCNGLSERIIARSRALALVNCPGVKDENVVVSAVFQNDYAIGYTAVFPEVFNSPSSEEVYYWGSTQWLEPEFRGKGISAKMMRILKDAIQNRYLGLDSTIASIKLDQKQGSDVVYYPRFLFVLDRDNLGLKGIIKHLLVKRRAHQIITKVEKTDYINRYVNFIDDSTYAFIREHSSQYLFLRKQEILNWQLTYPFLMPTWGDTHLEKDPCDFGSYIGEQWIKAVQVFVQEKLVGFYVLKCVDGCCTAMYMYYDEAYRENVFASITANMLHKGVKQIRTFSKALFDYMYAQGLRSLNRTHLSQDVSLTMPPGWLKDSSLEVQGGDGDMFC